MPSTTIVIPGRESQTIANIVMSTSDIVAAYAGDISLSGMQSSEVKDSDGNVTVTFANKTGTKGNDIYVNIDNINIDGDAVVNATRIVIPGREDQIIPNIVMTPADIRAAYAGTIPLEGMTATESDDDLHHVITFANKTGTKGQTDVLNQIFAAMANASAAPAATVAPLAPQAPAAHDVDFDFEEDDGDEPVEDVAVVNTRIIIPGREVQTIPNIVLDATLVRNSFASEIDLSGYDVEETEQGDTLEVRFSARTGTKGNGEA